MKISKAPVIAAEVITDDSQLADDNVYEPALKAIYNAVEALSDVHTPKAQQAIADLSVIYFELRAEQK